MVEKKIMIKENKKPNVVYRYDTPFIEYLEDLRRINICSEPREYYENAYKESPTLTIGQIIEKYPPKQKWARAQLLFYNNQLEEEVRKLYFDCITNDVTNYLLWKNLENITDRERKTLREKFRGKLPNIERKLNDNN